MNSETGGGIAPEDAQNGGPDGGMDYGPDGGTAGREGRPGAAGIADDIPEGAPDGSFGGSSGPEGADGNPEVWELSPSEDLPIPEENLRSFSAACRGAGLSREQAEKILDWHKGRFKEDQAFAAQREAKTLEDWRNDILADRDFGGANYRATVADARRALQAFDPDGRLRAFLRESRYQFNPDVIRAAARVGRAMGEHGFAGQTGAGGRTRPLEERMYPNMKF